MALFPCESCARHLRGSESMCPFCRAPRARTWLTAVAVSSALAVAACSAGTVYAGPPPGPPRGRDTIGPGVDERPTDPAEAATPTEDAKAPQTEPPREPASPSADGSSANKDSPPSAGPR